MRQVLLVLGFSLAFAGAAARSSAQTPAPPSGLEAVVARVRAGDDAGALARLHRLPRRVRSSARVRYLEGRLAERLGDHDRAAAAFEGLAGAELPAPVLEDLAFRRAEALAHTGRCAEAREALAAAGAGSGRRAARARARQAECLLAVGDLSAAVGALSRVALEDAVGVDTFAVRVSLAEAHHRAGDARAAIAELRALLVARPEHPDAAAAEAQLSALGGDVTFSPEERFARAERLHAQKLHREAVAELDAAGRPRDRASRARWLHLRGMALFKTRHAYPEAAQTLAEAARLPGPTREEDTFHAARALSRSDRDAQAIVAYRRFASRHRTHRRAAEAEFLAAWLELRLGRSRGEAAMARFVRSPRGRGTQFARSGTFELGLHAFSRGRHRDAAQRFEEYAAMGSDALVRARGLYWAGRALALSGSTDAAAARFRDAMRVEPLHYYALLARARLIAMGEAAPPPFPEAEARPAAPPLPAVSLPEGARFHASLGLRADALAVLRREEAAVRAAMPEGRGLEGLVRAYHELGEYARPYRLVVREARAELERRPDPWNRWIHRAAYPEAFGDAVAPAAEAEGLPPEYLWGIMRQESGYEPEAVSYADAIGLLQMMPSTTARVAEGLGVPFGRELLFDPAWNARFAAREIRQLFERFGTPLAFAAYNGGAHRVAAWQEAEPDADLDLLVERIPITQTKNYIRRVTTHYARYLYLRDPAASWPTIF